MKLLLRASQVTILAATLTGSASAATFVVTPAEKEDLPRILLKAVPGDSVVLAPGEYRGRYTLPAGVVFQSLKGPDSTILRGTFIATVEIQGKAAGTEIRGFTMNGRGGADLGVQDPGQSPLIEGCVFKDLHDGISTDEGEPVIRKNIFRGCRRGIALVAANGTIEENTLEGNTTGISLVSASPTIEKNRISRSNEGILLEQYSYPVVGGGLGVSNDFSDNVRHIVNRALATVGISRTQDPAVIVAKYNYWGTECPPVTKFFGQCRIKPWTDAAHEKRLSECPAGSAPADSATVSSPDRKTP